MPLMGVVVPMRVLVPAWTILSFFGSVTVLRNEFDNISWEALKRMLPACMVGVIFGVFFFEKLDSRTLAQGLGVIVILYGIRSYLSSKRKDPAPPMSIWRNARFAGLLSGAISTTFGALSSLFFAMHFDAIRMPKDLFRATMSAAIVGIAVMRGLGYLVVGAYSSDVLIVLAITMPMAVIGIYIGEYIQRELSEDTFRRLVHATLIVSGFAVLMSR